MDGKQLCLAGAERSDAYRRNVDIVLYMPHPVQTPDFRAYLFFHKNNRPTMTLTMV